MHTRTRGLIESCGSPISIELPKSVSLAWSSATIRILVAFTSACITAELWQNWSARAISRQMETRFSLDRTDSCSLSCNDVPHNSIVISDKLLPCSIFNIFTILACRRTAACFSDFITSLSFRWIILAATWSPERERDKGRCNRSVQIYISIFLSFFYILKITKIY